VKQFISSWTFFELFEPPLAAVGRGGAVFAVFMSVPEAAVDEDGGFVFGEENIDGDGPRTSTPHPGPLPGRGGEGDRNADVEAEAVAEAMQEGADSFFGRGVFAADAAHVPGTAFFCEQVFVHAKHEEFNHGWTRVNMDFLQKETEGTEAENKEAQGEARKAARNNGRERAQKSQKIRQEN
jgi:hypothetical protein